MNEHVFDGVDGRAEDLNTLRTDLEQQGRSLALLPPGSPITRETALDVIERCQHAIDAAVHPASTTVRGR